MSKLKVLMFSDSFYPTTGGRERVIDEQMKALSPLVDITLVCPKGKFDDATLPYKVYRTKGISFPHLGTNAIVDKRLKKFTKSNLPDVIYVQTKYALASYALKLKKKYGVPLVFACHTDYEAVYKQTVGIFAKPAIKAVVKKLNGADLVIAVSNFLKQKLIKLGVKTSIKVVPNGTIANAEFLANQANYLMAVKQKYELFGVNNLLLYVGRVEDKKNVAFMFSALADVKQVYKTNFKLLLAGKVEQKKYYKLAKKLKIDDSVMFLGEIKSKPELLALYTLADLLLSPTIADTYNLVVDEAGLCKTPSAIVTGTPMAERIVNGQNGIVSNLDKAEYAQKIFLFLKNKKDMALLGENAYNTLPKKYDQIAKTILDLFEKQVKR